MRRIVYTLRGYVELIVRAVDVEGVFVIGGTAILASAAGAFHPAGPGLVIGTVMLLAGLAIARPPKRS